MFQNPEQVLLIASVILFLSIFAGKAGYRFGLPALLLFLGGNVVWQRWSGHPVQRSECGPVYRHVGVEYHLVLGWYGYESCGGQTYRLARCGIGYARGAGHDFYHGRVYLLVIWFIWQICYVDFPGIFIAGGGHVLYGLSLGFLHLAQ